MGLTCLVEDGIHVIQDDGGFEVDDVVRIFTEIRNGAASGRSLRILIDDHGSDFNPDTAAMRRIVGTWFDLFEKGPTRLALLVTKDLHFGIGRMLGAMVEEFGFPFAVFRKRARALAWLNVVPVPTQD